MKKIFAICLVLITVMSMSLSVFAAPGKFVQSPSDTSAPVLIEVKPISPDCTGGLVLTPYSKRHTLDDEARKAIEAAYDEIVNALDLTKFCDVFATHVHKEKLSPEYLAVSDLFDISVFNCTHHEPHEGFIITVRFDSLTNFAGLLHRENGEWNMVEKATVAEDGKTLTFQVKTLSPFAIVVDTSDNAPDTGDKNNLAVYAVVAAVSAAALVVVFVALKKTSSKAK